MNKFLRHLFGAVETVSDYLVEYAFRQWGNGDWGVLPRWHFPDWWITKANEEGTIPNWYAGIFYGAGCKLLNLIPDTYWDDEEGSDYNCFSTFSHLSHKLFRINEKHIRGGESD